MGMKKIDWVCDEFWTLVQKDVLLRRLGQAGLVETRAFTGYSNDGYYEKQQE